VEGIVDRTAAASTAAAFALLVGREHDATWSQRHATPVAHSTDSASTAPAYVPVDGTAASAPSVSPRYASCILGLNKT